LVRCGNETLEDATAVKFRRASPWSWALFFVTAVNVTIAAVAALILDRLARSEGRSRIVLSGHRFNGNLLAFHDYAHERDLVEVRYVHIDYAEYRRCRAAGFGSNLTTVRLDHVMWIAQADLMMTDHGPGIWRLLQILRPSIAFVEVWHGIGYKALGAGFKSKMRNYAAVFAGSDWDAEHSFIASGIDAAMVRVTGYAATDPLVTPFERDPTYPKGTTVMIAPTWSHNANDRQGLPFGLDTPQRLTELSEWAQLRGIHVVMRTHLNTKEAHLAIDLPQLMMRPVSDWPVTYDLLKSTDVLVTDWSSIAIDFLPLQRPIIFMDIPPPFSQFRLSPADRPGPLAADWQSLLRHIERAVSDPATAMTPFDDSRRRVAEHAFGSTLDGRSAERYLDQARRLCEKTA
jgi:hypothetical protein